jgi:hypothetical protein
MASITVTRKSQSFVVPSSTPTPTTETLELSAIDRVPGLRHTVRSLHVFRRNDAAAAAAAHYDAAAAGRPAEVIRAALSRALVDYRPFAGRFVGSLYAGEASVECTDDGAWFVDAVTDCSLDDVNGLDYPLMVSEEELLPAPEEGVDPTSIPIMMQVYTFVLMKPENLQHVYMTVVSIIPYAWIMTIICTCFCYDKQFMHIKNGRIGETLHACHPKQLSYFFRG